MDGIRDQKLNTTIKQTVNVIIMVFFRIFLLLFLSNDEQPMNRHKNKVQKNNVDCDDVALAQNSIRKKEFFFGPSMYRIEFCAVIYANRCFDVSSYGPTNPYEMNT